jgi:hypothetical protein
MIRSLSATFLGLVAIAGLAVTARADIFSGTIAGDDTLTPTGTTGVYVVNFSGSGVDANFGLFTATSTDKGDFSHPPNIVISDGMFSEVFLGGSLFGVSSGSGTANGTGAASLTLDYVVQGGSGDFAGDTGNIAVTGTLTTSGPTTGAFSGNYSGTLTAAPEPSVFVPLAPIVLGLLWRTRARRRSPQPE